jgi:hypothetical protein
MRCSYNRNRDRAEKHPEEWHIPYSSQELWMGCGGVRIRPGQGQGNPGRQLFNVSEVICGLRAHLEIEN